MTIETVFLFNTANTYGLQQDAKVLDALWRSCPSGSDPASGSNWAKGPPGAPKIKDPLQPPVICDVAVHFEVPYYGWMPWARINIFVINPEWWEAAWDPYLDRADVLLFKCKADKERFMETRQGFTGKAISLPWTTNLTSQSFAKLPKAASTSPSCLWLLGASVAKREAAKVVLPLWDASWPELKVYTTTPLDFPQPLAPNVSLEIRDLPEDTRRQLQAYHPIHLIFSQSEALGLAAHEGRAAGAALLGNALPSYTECFTSGNQLAVLTAADLVSKKGGVQDTFKHLTKEVLQTSLTDLLTRLNSDTRTIQQVASAVAQADLTYATHMAIQDLLNSDALANRKKTMRTLPPVLQDSECPPISIITLLHNRRKFVDLALHNLLITDYPKDKIEWVVIEDSDKVEEQASDKIIKFGREAAPLSVSYVPLQKPLSIGEKRNIGCKRAQHDIILMMDDDDHYPPTSFRRRVSWLLKHPWQPQATVCTTIACYDLLKGTSAVNTPPWSLGLPQRCSEATLTFKKSYWEAGSFPEISMAEGEGFLSKYTSQVLELQPQQIIVAMSHAANSSSRRIPPGPSGKPSCFWGFPKEFLIFLHRLAGVEIEEETSSKKASKK